MSLSNADFARSYSAAINGSAASASKDAPSKVDAAKLLSWFSDAYRASESWRTKAIESLKMVNNEQWDASVLAQLPPNMAPVTINLMLMPLMYLSGVQRQTRQEPKIVASGGGNPAMAEMMNELVHWVEGQANADETDSRVFLDKLTTGLGWWKYAIEYDCDDLEGEISPMRRHALSIFPDPNFFDARWKDAQYVFDSQYMTIAEAAEKWPDYADEFKTQAGEWLRTAYGAKNAFGVGASGEETGDSFAEERWFWDEKTKRVRILECWYKETKKQKIGVNFLHPEDPVIKADEVKQLEDALEQQPELAQEWTVFTKPMTLVRVAHLFHDKVLDDELSPFEECPGDFPIFPSVGFYFWKEPFGLAELMKSLQMEKNKRRSKLIELVGRMPLSGFFNKEQGGADSKQLQEYGAGNGIEISYKTDPPVPIRPPDLPMAVVHLEDNASKDIKEATNVHDELLGQATQKTISGAAIEARQRGGFISHEMLFDTFRLEKEARVKFEIGVIKQYVSPTKALRILGKVANQGNQQMGQMLDQAAQDPMAAQEVMQLLSDTFDAEYDCIITSKPTEPSLAMQAWETLSELKQQGAEIPPQTLWQAAQKAGVLTEDQVQEILQFVQQQQQPPSPQGPPTPGMPPPGMQGPPPQGPPPPQ